MKRPAMLVTALLIAIGSSQAAQRYSASGVVLKVDPAQRTLVVSCRSIPGYMDAMVMPFAVRDAKSLEHLAPGAMIDFTLVVDGQSSYAQDICIRGFESPEQEPQAARRLSLLDEILDPSRAEKLLRIGQPVPDFALIDQQRRPITLSQFVGKVVAVTFIYTRCPLPNYCFRLSNNFGLLQKRFAPRMGRDLVLLSISFDPVHDQPEVLAKYGAIWKADPKAWHLLTGPLSDVQNICQMFGMNSWPDEGLMTHSLRTVIIDREGKLAANLEGNEFTAGQLGDLVQVTLDGSAPSPRRSGLVP